ncbi:Uncharacterised protein [Mycobacteroides abscessus subsp. massiliense]|nr:Uncharacterised protein [Mycobacteroides abscessus subsp. massiliense]
MAARSHVRGADFWRAQLALDLPALSTSGARCPAWTQRLALACGGDAHAGVPLWNGAQHWARISVPAAYAARYKQLCDDGALGKWDRITLEKGVGEQILEIRR